MTNQNELRKVNLYIYLSIMIINPFHFYWKNLSNSLVSFSPLRTHNEPIIIIHGVSEPSIGTS